MSTTTTATATAVLQFVGLILFSHELSPDRALIGLAPRISGHASHHGAPPPAMAKTIARREKSETRPEVVDTVEEHAAFIAFPARDYLSSKGWPPSGLETANGYLFVRLDGEHVTFRSEGRFGTVSSTAEVDLLGRKSSHERLDRDAMGLPHLQPCCKGAKLKKEFQAPDYPGAVAVFHLPSLKVKGCNANSKDVNVNASRVDSRTAIDNNGVLVIAATRKGQEKTMRVNGNATIIVAHMPMDVITGKRGGGGNARHYQAYYDMIEEGSCSPDYRTCAQSSAPRDSCFDRSIVREGTIVLAGGEIVRPEVEEELPWWASARTDFECSNTQWP